MCRFSFLPAAALLLAIAMLKTPVVAEAQVPVAGQPEALTTGDQTYMAPKWSPDGSRIALSGDGYGGIYLLDPETGTVQSVTDEPGSGYGFSWSPSGQTILARVAQFDGPRRMDAVQLFDLSSGETRRLTEFRYDMPSVPRWDASGSRVFLHANGKLEVFRQSDAAGKSQDDEPVMWVTAKMGLATADLLERQVQQSEVVGDRRVLNLTSSPNGARIAFEMLGGNLFSMKTDGTDLVDLGPGHRPSWSPDGEWLVYMRTQDDGHTFTSSDLYAARADGSSTVQLTNTRERLEMNPDWSPDGSRIAYDDFRDGIVYALPVSR